MGKEIAPLTQLPETNTNGMIWREPLSLNEFSPLRSRGVKVNLPVLGIASRDSQLQYYRFGFGKLSLTALLQSGENSR